MAVVLPGQTTPIRAVLLDMDGVLVDSEEILAGVAIDLFRETYGVDVRREAFAPFVGGGEIRFLTGVGEAHGLQVSIPKDKDDLYRRYLDRIPGTLKPLPGVFEFLAEARRRDLKLAVATSADRVKMEASLAEIGLSPDTFAVRITGDRIQRLKPDPEIFLTAAHGVGESPAACLVVEDALRGVEAARAAGCACLGIASSFSESQLNDAGADWAAPDLHHALRTLAWTPDPLE